MESRPPLHAITSLPAPQPPPASGSASAVPPKLPVFAKMEALVREMQDPETGIPIRSQKLFLTSIPSAFMGYDLIEWLMERLDVEDSAEAIHLANLLCQYGYFFPVGESRSLIVKDDSSLYRFQTPYYWPSQNHTADTTDYAIYLTKRLARNKQKHGLEDYELETYAKLKKGLQHKWDFVTMQAEEQVRLAKERKKGDKIVTDSQERAYWRVYRPPQGFTNCLEMAPVPDKTNMANRVRKKTVEVLTKEEECLTQAMDRTRSKASVTNEALVNHSEVFAEYDPFLVTPHPSNPWISDEEEFWLLNDDYAETPTERRVKRWAINFMELISDPLGMTEFTNYLRKEYSHENIRFWQAVNELRYGTASSMNDAVESIYEEFLKPGAPCEINIDGKTMEETQNQRRQPTRYTYDLASEHVYVLLLKKDCYPRFLRSEDYKNLLATALQPSAKKPRFFHLKSGPGRKKTSTSAATSNSLALVAVTPQPLKRHGSDEHQQLGGKGGDAPNSGGVHLGGSTPTPPLSSHKVDCEPPYSASSETQDTGGQSSVCPWDTAETSNVCPWETSDPPPPSSTAGTKQPAQPPAATPQHLQSFRVEPSSSHLKGKPPDRSVSVDVCSLGASRGGTSSNASMFPSSGGSSAPATATGGPHPIGSTAEDSKVTLNICPWETQDIQKQEKSRSMDVDVCPWETPSDIPKKGSNTSIPSIVGSQDAATTAGDKSPSGSVHSHTDRRPSIRGEREVVCAREEEKSSGASPAVSLQDLQQIARSQFLSSAETSKPPAHRLSTDLSNVKISVESSTEFEKPLHRELSASISVPCTSILTQHGGNLDYTVRSGHLPSQYGAGHSNPPSVTTTSAPGAAQSGSGELPHSSSHSVLATISQSTFSHPIDDSDTVARNAPSSQVARRHDFVPRTVSVSSQTQTDPIVHHRTNQQTQHPSRDSVRHSSRHRHTKQTSTQLTGDARGQAAQQGPCKHSSREQQMQLQLYQVTQNNQLKQKQLEYQYHQQQLQQQQQKLQSDQHLARCNQQQRQHQYLLSREDYEQQQQRQNQQQQHIMQQQKLVKQLQEQQQTERHQKHLEEEVLKEESQLHHSSEQKQADLCQQMHRREYEQMVIREQRHQRQLQDEMETREHEQQIRQEKIQHQQVLQEQHDHTRHQEMLQDSQIRPELHYPAEHQHSLHYQGDVQRHDVAPLQQRIQEPKEHHQESTDPQLTHPMPQQYHREVDDSKFPDRQGISQDAAFKQAPFLVSEGDARPSSISPCGSFSTLPPDRQESPAAVQQLSQQLQIASSHQHPQISSSQHHHHQPCLTSKTSTQGTHPRITEGQFSASQSVSSSEELASYSGTQQHYPSSSGFHSIYQETGDHPPLTSSSPLQVQAFTSHVQIETSSGQVQIQTSTSQVPHKKSAEEHLSHKPTSPKKPESSSKVWTDPGDICPWEDEESCRADAPFVKTYATLGYL